ncbi:MAG: RNA polymerase sigma factor RpoD/SigA [Candidatus Aminicenantes bacterium]|nr:RNA polymerase sigma factor RpoD/SigA [Candidatus Aminicenantes bacterium]MDH5385310.1 RNA polymerase sigma factor RpoD/SigA [Candidatus Aminicenantes bacterium]
MRSDFKNSLDSRNLAHYLRQIAKFPPLKQNEEKELGKQVQKGDKKALRKLVESNLRFVVSYVKKYGGMGLSLPDLINEGNLGLIEAAKRFDPEKNVKFISYAVWWIRQAIIHALTKYSRIYHIPQKLSDQISEMKRIKTQLKKDLGRDPAREETAKRMKIDVEDIEDLEILEEKDISLSDKYYDDDVEVGDRIKDTLSPSVELQIIKNSVQENIRNILDQLDEKEADVLKLRFGIEDKRLKNKYGIEDFDPQTLQEIGDKLNLTRERIRQIEKKAMRKLAHSHKLQQLRGYLN